jgi:hypothetical protein
MWYLMTQIVALVFCVSASVVELHVLRVIDNEQRTKMSTFKIIFILFSVLLYNSIVLAIASYITSGIFVLGNGSMLIYQWLLISFIVSVLITSAHLVLYRMR